MLRDIFTNKWILSGIGFLVIFAGLCYLWYQHDTAPYRKQAAKLDAIIQQFEKQQTAPTAKPTEQAADAPAESTTPTAEKATGIETIGAATDKTSEPVTTSTSPTDNTKEARVSAFGFGPYPEVPPDYPDQEAFTRTYDHPDFELMDRIDIKLWTQGVHALGGSFDNGLYYPTIKGVIYVEWDTTETETGPKRYAARTHSTREDLDFWDPRKGPLWEGDIPAHLEVRDFADGINPYTFLDLK